MKVALSGSHGFLGGAIFEELQKRGIGVVRLLRGEVQDKEALEGAHAVIHLAGEPVARGRWTQEKKKEIYESRVIKTQLLAHDLASLNQKPKTFLCASALGFYGDRGEEILTEESDPGSTFLSKVCVDWEAATSTAKEAGIRVVNLRFGMVLGKTGGALKRMLPLFRLGLGGKLGSGKQHVSWVHIDDVVRAVFHVLEHQTFQGPINVVSPSPVTNEQFTKTLGTLLKRPTPFPVPRFLMKAMFGEMAEVVFLASTRIEPRRLLESGFSFQFQTLESALSSLRPS